jgi:hypothetical protein
MGDKLLEYRTNIAFVVTLEKSFTDVQNVKMMMGREQ